MCDVMGRMTPAVSCGDGDSLQVDGTYLNESLKGRGRRGAYPAKGLTPATASAGRMGDPPWSMSSRR